MSYIKKFINHGQGSLHCSFFFFDWFIVIAIKFFFMWHVFVSRIFTYFKFIHYSQVSFFWFFICVTLLIIYHVHVIVLKGYMGGCFFKHVGHLWGVLLLSRRIPQISAWWSLAGTAAAALIAIYVGLF